MIEQTLVLLKPDAVARGIMGRIISRFEDSGLKIVGMKMQWVDEEFAAKHYYDVKERHGEKILNSLTAFLSMGPVLAIVIEGSSAIENVRKLVGSTEPKGSPAGTIRGDFSHLSYARADGAGKAAYNVIHATANKKDSDHEIPLWFSKEEIHSYKSVHEEYSMLK